LPILGRWGKGGRFKFSEKVSSFFMLKDSTVILRELLCAIGRGPLQKTKIVHFFKENFSSTTLRNCLTVPLLQRVLGTNKYSKPFLAAGIAVYSFKLLYELCLHVDPGPVWVEELQELYRL